MLKWDKLVIDTRTPEFPVTQERFADWMAEKRIVVSSTIMDLQEERQAVRELIQSYGAAAVMWEEPTVTPQTQPAEHRTDKGLQADDGGTDRQSRRTALVPGW